MFDAMRQFGTIRAARKAALVALSSASSSLEQEALNAIQIFAVDPKLREYFRPGTVTTEKLGGWNGISQKMVSYQKSSVQVVLDAASLVFAHSVFDAALLDCCRSAAMACPSDWECFVKKRQFTVGDLKGQSYEDILQAAIESELRKLYRDSALAKVDRILALCRPGSAILASEGYVFDRDRLVAIDAMRHDIVHGKGPRQLENVEEDVTYLEATIFRMLSAVMERYNVMPDGAALNTAANEAFSKE
jgi:hypothetical protein